jgi:CBS-domain-containing membrane protein
VIGVVSEADLLHRLEFAGDEKERHLFERRSRRAGRAKAHGDNAAALMTAPAVTVRSDESVVAAAKLMQTERVKRLPVVDRGGRLVGIVARSDLLKTFLRPDSAIRADVMDEVRGVLQVDPGAVDVEVAGGVVTLRGRVDRRSTAMVAVRLTRAVAGVVDVVDQTAWAFDDIEVSEAGVHH